MHTAILAREIRRTIPKSKIPDLSVWILRSPLERALETSGQVISALTAMAKKTSPKEANAKLRLERNNRKKRRGKKR